MTFSKERLRECKEALEDNPYDRNGPRYKTPGSPGYLYDSEERRCYEQGILYRPPLYRWI